MQSDGERFDPRVYALVLGLAVAIIVVLWWFTQAFNMEKP